MHDVDAGLTLGCCCVYTKEVPRVRTQRAERVKQMTREGGATRDRLWDASGPGECLFDSKEGTIVQTTYVNLRNRVFSTNRGREATNTVIQQGRDLFGRFIRSQVNFPDSLVAKYALRWGTSLARLQRL